jgi:hypothetical protein
MDHGFLDVYCKVSVYKHLGDRRSPFCPQLYDIVCRVKLKMMAVYLARSCPKCRNYLGIVIAGPKNKGSVQSIRGRCNTCGYEVNWTLLQVMAQSVLDRIPPGPKLDALTTDKVLSTPCTVKRNAEKEEPIYGHCLLVRRAMAKARAASSRRGRVHKID